MSEPPRILLEHRLKMLKLPTFLREYEKVARQSAQEGLDHVRFLSRLVELELIDRERRLVERRIKAAKFPTVKSLDSFEFKAIPSLNKAQVLELARCEWIERRENVIALGPSGTGKSHVAQGLGLAACQRGMSVRFVTAAAARARAHGGRAMNDACCGCKSSSPTTGCSSSTSWGSSRYRRPGAELLFELVSQRYERGGASHHLKPSLRRMDRNVRLGAPHRGVARPPHPSCPYPGNERPRASASTTAARGKRPPRADRRAILSRKLRSGYALPAFPAPAASSRIPTPSDHLTPTVAVAVFCSALWSGFSPPLTPGSRRSFVGIRPIGGRNWR